MAGGPGVDARGRNQNWAGQIAGVDHHGGAERGLSPEAFDHYGLSFDHYGLSHASRFRDDVIAIGILGGNAAICEGGAEQKTAPIPNCSNSGEVERLP